MAFRVELVFLWSCSNLRASNFFQSSSLFVSRSFSLEGEGEGVRVRGVWIGGGGGQNNYAMVI